MGGGGGGGIVFFKRCLPCENGNRYRLSLLVCEMVQIGPRVVALKPKTRSDGKVVSTLHLSARPQTGGTLK